MKWIVTIAIILMGMTKSFAQDEIYLFDGTMIRANVLSIDPIQIRYKMWGKEDGPTFVVNKMDVALIRHPDGTYDFIADKYSEDEMKAKKSVGPEFRRAIIGFDLLGLVYGDVNFSAEYLFFDRGIFGLRIPYTIGTADDGYRPFDTQWMSGVDLNYYPLGQMKWSYFTGLGFRFGDALTRSCELVINQFGGQDKICEETPYEFYGVYLNNGVRFTPAKHFSIFGMMGLGYREDVGKNPGDTHAIFAGSVQFRF